MGTGAGQRRNLRLRMTAYDEMDLSLTAVRTVRRVDDLGKSFCAAEMTNLAHPDTERRLSVEYTAQYTDDGQVYVEVMEAASARFLIPPAGPTRRLNDAGYGVRLWHSHED